jgi:CrcB protein
MTTAQKTPLADSSAPEPAHSTAAEALVIAFGGAIGASLRYAVAIATELAGLHGAWATTGANLSGSLLLGLLLSDIDAPVAHSLLRPFLVIGVFGSFTTFSALALDNRLLAGSYGEGWAGGQLALSIGMGLLSFTLGVLLRRGFR